MPGPALFRSTSSDPEPCQRQPPLLMPWSVHVTVPAKSYSNTPAPRYRENSSSETGASHFSPRAAPPTDPTPLSCPALLLGDVEAALLHARRTGLGGLASSSTPIPRSAHATMPPTPARE